MFLSFSVCVCVCVHAYFNTYQLYCSIINIHWTCQLQIGTCHGYPLVNAGNVRDAGSVPRSRRFLGVGNGNPLQYSYWENPMNRGAWWATVPCGCMSWTCLKWLSSHMGTCHLPLQGLSYVLLHLPTSKTPEGVQGGENRILCVPGKLSGQVFRYVFSGADFLCPFMYLLISRKELKSLMAMTISCD